MSRKVSREDIRVKELRDALQPLADKGVTREEAYILVWTAVRSMRQGSSIDHALPGILNTLFPKTPEDISNDIRACQDYVYKALVEQMRFRKHTDLEWITNERKAVSEASGRWAAENLYPRYATPEDVERIEIQACGHIDYASKLALYIAEFVVTGKDPRP